jgi:peptidoglycan-associated lipoprotein
MKITLTTFVICCSIVITAGCATDPSLSDAQVTPASNQAARKGAYGEDANAYGYDAGARIDGQITGGPGSSGVERVVYFDFDSATIRPDSRPVIDANARYLVEHSNAAIILEGHTDERGTREYNIGLGERRAEAVRRLMIAYGVAPQQLRTLSYGEERPAMAGQTEDSYSQNRRVEIVY